MQHLLHQLKYHNHPEVGVKLGRLCGRELIKRGIATSFDIIVPIPMHVSKVRKRGYNQSEKFAEGLSLEMRIPCVSDGVVRTHRAQTQTKKSAVERWQNVEHVFTVLKKHKIKGQHVLLVDDVLTTGSTLEACGIQLSQGECSQLSVVCIAEA